MELEKALSNLKDSFHAVAVAAQKELPEIWAEAIDIWKDKESAVRFLCKEHMNLEGQSPLERASKDENGRKEVLDLLNRIKYGVY